MKYDPITATFEEATDLETGEMHLIARSKPIQEAPTLELHDRFEQVLGD